jgi:predicted enzyme related to lactoylglutathione lyase
MAVHSICGVILISEDVEALARFYRDGLGLALEREEHGGLDIHYGADIGEVHFGIHPTTSFAGRGPSRATPLAFAVTSIDEHLAKVEALGATIVVEPHDEGFGPVVTCADPQGNLFELVELKHEFGTQNVASTIQR